MRDDNTTGPPPPIGIIHCTMFCNLYGLQSPLIIQLIPYSSINNTSLLVIIPNYGFVSPYEYHLLQLSVKNVNKGALRSTFLIAVYAAHAWLIIARIHQKDCFIPSGIYLCMASILQQGQFVFYHGSRGFFFFSGSVLLSMND